MNQSQLFGLFYNIQFEMLLLAIAQGKFSYSDDYHGESQTRDHDLSTDLDPQNTF